MPCPCSNMLGAARCTAASTSACFMLAGFNRSHLQGPPRFSTLKSMSQSKEALSNGGRGGGEWQGENRLIHPTMESLNTASFMRQIVREGTSWLRAPLMRAGIPRQQQQGRLRWFLTESGSRPQCATPSHLSRMPPRPAASDSQGCRARFALIQSRLQSKGNASRLKLPEEQRTLHLYQCCPARTLIGYLIPSACNSQNTTIQVGDRSTQSVDRHCGSNGHGLERTRLMWGLHGFKNRRRQNECGAIPKLQIKCVGP